MKNPSLSINQSRSALHLTPKESEDSQKITNTASQFHQNINLTSAFSCGLKYKYFNTFILFISALCNSMVGVTLATINHQVTSYYGIETSIVSLAGLITFIINPMVTIIANYILDNKGLKLGISINCIFVIIGVSLRMLISKGFQFVIIGNSLNAMGGVFLINCPPRFSAIWFTPRQRIIITSLLVLANGVSGQIGAIMAPYFVSDNLTPEQGRNAIQNLMNFQAILITFVMLVNLIFFRGIPNKNSQSYQDKLIQKIQKIKQPHHSSQQISEKLIPQSSVFPEQKVIKSESILKKQKRARYFNQLKTLLTTKNYLLVLIAFVLVCSVLSCFALNIELYILPFGFTSQDAGYLTMASVASGLVGSILSSLIIKKLKKFKIVILVEIFLSILSSATFLVSLMYTQKELMYISVCLFTMLLYPLFPAMIQYSCQFMHPIRESTIAGILISTGQIFSFGIGFAQTYLLGAKTQQNAIICLGINVICYVIALISVSFTKQNLKRLIPTE